MSEQRKTLILPSESSICRSGPVRVIYSRTERTPFEPGHLSHGGAIVRTLRTVACAECGETFESTSPNARWCAECGKRRLRAQQAAWMREKRSGKQ